MTGFLLFQRLTVGLFKIIFFAVMIDVLSCTDIKDDKADKVVLTLM